MSTASLQMDVDTLSIQLKILVLAYTFVHVVYKECETGSCMLSALLECIILYLKNVALFCHCIKVKYLLIGD